MTYTAHDNAVWFGPTLWCRAANEEYAKAIAEALELWSRE